MNQFHFRVKVYRHMTRVSAINEMRYSSGLKQLLEFLGRLNFR